MAHLLNTGVALDNSQPWAYGAVACPRSQSLRPLPGSYPSNCHPRAPKYFIAHLLLSMRSFSIFRAFIVTCALSALIVRATPIPADRAGSSVQGDSTVPPAIPSFFVTPPDKPTEEIEKLEKEFKRYQVPMHDAKGIDDVTSNFESWLQVVKDNQDLLKTDRKTTGYCKSFVQHVVGHLEKVTQSRRKEGFNVSSLEKALIEGKKVEGLLKSLEK
ncbi:hypothetical protein H0H93_011373 [Arthromyces matolae]|nr:hypothetical protein H0H93_011373 [Arthromyces matolae]